MLTEERNTEYPTGDLDSFLHELDTPKQNMGINQESIINEAIPEEPEQDFSIDDTNPAEDDDKLILDAFTSQAAAEILVGIIDTALPAGLAAIAKDDKVEDFQAEDEQRKTLTKGFKKYLDAKGLDLPPGWLLFFLVITIYGVKVPTAISMRRQQNEISENEAIIANQKRQIQQQKRQIAALKKEQEQEETKEETKAE